MTKRRRSLVVGLGLTVLGGLFAGAAAYSLLYPFPVRAHQRIKLGMTRPEVVAAIGAEPGHYNQDRRLVAYAMAVGTIPIRWRVETGVTENALRSEQLGDRWTWDGYCLDVDFDNEGKAVRTELVAFQLPTFWDRLRAWVGV